MILLSLLAMPISTPPAIYDFYYESVQKGSCRVTRDGDDVRLTSDPGFMASSKLQLHLEASSPSDAIYNSATSGKIVYTLSGPDARAKSGPLYSPLYPALLPYVLGEYDLRKGGFQTLHTTNVAQNKPRDVSAELFRTAVREVGGRKQPMREWRFVTPPTAEAVIWTDVHNQPLSWWVPAQNFEIVRRGFESLRPSAKFEKAVSPARFQVKMDAAVRVPMRDGICLLADVYRPDAPGRYPVILQRTCYDRSEFGLADGEFFAQRGYVYVAQHVRGRGGSEGKFEPEWNEKSDGYDSVAWAGTQPWSDGKVGMVGASYNAFCGWMAAKTQPKWLKTLISVVPMPGPPYGAPWAGGAQYIGDTLGWFGLLRDPLKVQPYNDDMTKALNTLPLSKADDVQFGHDLPEFDKRIRPNRYDANVQRESYREDIGKIKLPVLYFDGWLDPVAVGTRMNYLSMVGHAPNQKLIWGPWTHFTNRESSEGVTDFTPDGYVDMRTITLRWFDRWLKDARNGIDKEPTVSEYLLGENHWYQAKSWPPKNMKPERWYLGSHKDLSTKPCSPGKPSGYVYDPAAYVYSSQFSFSYILGKGYDVSSVCKRSGQLIFDSKPLKKPVRLDGPIRGKLFAATSAKDTDWVMALLDVRPDGVAVPLQTGYIRARYRKSFARPVLLKPGEVFGYDIDLWQMGVTIPAGHRLRVVVCSSLFPDLDRNLNTGEPIADATRMVVARQTIYHDAAHPSYVELPVLVGSGVG